MLKCHQINSGNQDDGADFKLRPNEHDIIVMSVKLSKLAVQSIFEVKIICAQFGQSPIFLLLISLCTKKRILATSLCEE